MAGGAVTDATIRTRFAPSPTGLLHLGHAYAALFAAQAASPGAFLLRIEDIDRERCSAEFETAIYDDLHWLGLDWPQPVMRQSDRLDSYAAALDRLTEMGVTYPCSCTRGDIRAALSAPQEGAPILGPDGLVYPGSCRGRPMHGLTGDEAIRLDAAAAFDLLGAERLSLHDGRPQYLSRDAFLSGIGDVVLARRGMGTSYHLSVVVDDAAQGITLVTRGQDLAEAGWIHVLLQALLDLPQPRYRHHRLIRDEDGKRLAKRDNARSLRALREAGVTPAEVRQMLQPIGA
ncbi:tRNA glutamyl-Q(34) synthetase GluQRS [Paracoccus jeotgali]|uniref:tRNA glutamyl-Q(34) synthetase GluQRS n=1 Tax=Paracoccus jeotgali TaxID=2065379 RepID=UPI0028A5DDCC|nr:tRNA glutamyl-Q(34) synthetase GluQRS [Paracoccus jeotgali]